MGSKVTLNSSVLRSAQDLAIETWSINYIKLLRSYVVLQIGIVKYSNLIFKTDYSSVRTRNFAQVFLLQKVYCLFIDWLRNNGTNRNTFWQAAVSPAFFRKEGTCIFKKKAPYKNSLLREGLQQI